MSDDWRKKAKNSRDQEIEEIRQNKEREHLGIARRIENEEEKRLKSLQRRFKCYICSRQPTQPLPGGQRTTGFGESEEWETNWDVPGDLHLCHKCNKWTCEDHYESGICMNCAEGVKTSGRQSSRKSIFLIVATMLFIICCTAVFVFPYIYSTH